jgi:hypothetical protein
MDLHLMKMTYYFIYTQDTKGTHHKLLYQALPISSFKYLNQKIWQIHIFTSTYFEILLIIEFNLGFMLSAYKKSSNTTFL